MKKLAILLLLITGLKVEAQKIDTCSTPIFINYGYAWRLKIDTDKYGEELTIKNRDGLFKVKIDTCLGNVNLSYYKSDTLREQGILKIHKFLAIDSNFIEDEFGDLLAVPYYSFPASKTGTWLYWTPKGNIKKEEGIR